MPMLNQLGRFPNAFIPKPMRVILRKIVHQMEQENCPTNTVVIKWCQRRLN